MFVRGCSLFVWFTGVVRCCFVYIFVACLWLAEFPGEVDRSGDFLEGQHTHLASGQGEICSGRNCAERVCQSSRSSTGIHPSHLESLRCSSPAPKPPPTDAFYLQFRSLVKLLQNWCFKKLRRAIQIVLLHVT